MKSSKTLSLSLYVEKFVPGGEALASFADRLLPDGSENPYYGKKVFLWNALPGEKVKKFQVLKEKSSYLEAVALEIDSPSLRRVAPKDACFLSTSPWQILDWDYELEQKRELIKESLSQAHLELPDGVEVEPVKTDGTEWSYRNKMEYSLYWDNAEEKIFLAFHNRGSHAKIPLKPSSSPSDASSGNPASSSLERKEIAEKAFKIVEELNSAHASARDFQSLLLRSSQSGVVSGGLFENKKPHPTFENLSDTLLGHEYSYSPNGFFQINLPVYELALKEIKKAVDASPNLKVLDLYAGVGTIGLSVAPSRDLTLVECNKDAFRELKNNAKDWQGINPVFTKSEDALDYIAPDEIVILDPPRAGCDKKLIDRLLEACPKKIIYLSCNPSTQARDVALLTIEGRYKISRILPFNFFPKTPHIENLIILEL